MRRTIWWCCLLCLLSASAGASRCDVDALPSAAQRVLSQRFGGWKIVTNSDLSPDDQPIWSEYYGDACPGVVEGNFTGDGGRQFAVTLIRGNESPLRQILVLLKPRGLRSGDDSAARGNSCT